MIIIFINFTQITDVILPSINTSLPIAAFLSSWVIYSSIVRQVHRYLCPSLCYYLLSFLRIWFISIFVIIIIILAFTCFTSIFSVFSSITYCYNLYYTVFVNFSGDIYFYSSFTLWLLYVFLFSI